MIKYLDICVCNSFTYIYVLLFCANKYVKNLPIYQNILSNPQHLLQGLGKTSPKNLVKDSILIYKQNIIPIITRYIRNSNFQYPF